MVVGTVRFNLDGAKYVKIEEHNHPITGTYWDVKVIHFDVGANKMEEVLDSYCVTNGSAVLELLAEIHEQWNT